MKKLVYTIAALVVLNHVSSAQNEPKKKEDQKQKVEKKESVNPDGTPSTVEQSASDKPGGSKKTSTRMAINEKGTPVEKKPKKSTGQSPK